MEEEAGRREMGVAVEVVDTRAVDRARPPDDAVDFVVFGEKELGEVGAVLAGDAGDKCFFLV